MKKFIKETSKKIATGALAILATIGSANIGVFAGNNTPTGSTEITGHSGGSTSTAWTSGDELSLSDSGDQTGTIPVKGYQTAKAYNYEIKVSWGDMKFIFDRGVYDSSNNTIKKKVTGGENNVWDYCEAGVKSDGSAASVGEGVDKWCGFNGTNNHVNVENLGNGDVQMAVACTEGASSGATSSDLGNNVDLQIAVTNTDVSSTEDNWSFTGPTTNDKYMRNFDGNAVQMTIAPSGTSTTTTIQKAFNLETGSSAEAQHAANQVEFYLNITGEPNPTNNTPVPSNNASQLNVLDSVPTTDAGWEQLGTINLTFTPQADS